METVIIDNYLLLSDGENVVVYDIITRSIYKSRDSLDKIKKKIKTKNYIRTESHNVRLPKKMKEDKEDNEDNSFLLFVGIASAETCNLACRYCYANAGTYNNINKVIMSFEDYKLLFEKILKIFPKGVVGYTFFGGEPMLGFKEIVKFVEYVTTISKKNKNIIEPRFAIVTNGTLIDQYAYEIFERYNFAVTISLDGPKEITDKMRIFRNGHRSVFEIVKHNLEKCSIQRTHLLVAEATLSEFFFKSYKQGYAREYFDTFVNLGFDSFFPYYAETTETNNVVTNDANLRYGIKQFYYDLVDYSFELLLDDIKFKLIPNPIAATVINIMTGRETNVCPAGKRSIFYTASGDVYPCQLYYAAKYKKLGNISDENELKININSYKLISRNEINECANCFAKSFCSFWCPGSSYLFSNSEYTVNKVRCLIQRSIAERIIYNLVLIFENELKKRIFIQNLGRYSQLYSPKNLWGVDS